MSIKHFDFPDVGQIVKFASSQDGRVIGTPTTQTLAISRRKGVAYVADRALRAPIPGTTLLPHLGYYRGDYEMDRTTASGTLVSKSDPKRIDTLTGWIRARETVPVNLGFDYIEPPDWEECDALVQAAYANCAADFDLATTLAEAHKTAAMARNVHRDLRRMIRQGMTHGFGADLALDARMQWRYGWRLLSYDLDNLVKLLPDPFSGVIVTGKAKNAPIVTENTVHDSISFTNAIVSFTDTTRRSRQVRAKAAVYYRTRTLNVGWSAPTTTWELVPLSWVLDLFVSIGSMIEAWDVIRSADAYTASVGVLQSDYHEGYESYGSTPYYSAHCGQASIVEKRVQRARYPHGLPSILPHIRVRLKSATLLDLASILKKRLRVPAAMLAVTLGTLQGGD